MRSPSSPSADYVPGWPHPSDQRRAENIASLGPVASSGATTSEVVLWATGPQFLTDEAGWYASGEPDVGSILRTLGDRQQEFALLFKPFLAMPENWDAYGARPVNPFTFERVMQLLSVLSVLKWPEPFVGPTSAGGLSLEWHQPHSELVLDIPPDDLPTAYFYDGESGQEWEERAPADSLLLPAIAAR